MKKFIFTIMILILFFLATSVKGQENVGIADTPWPMYQHDPQHTGQSPFLGPTQKPEVLWTVKMSDCVGENGGLSIAKDGSLLASQGGCLQSFDPYTRQNNWTHLYGSHSRSVALVSSDDNIYWGYANVISSISKYGAKNWAAALDANYVFGSSPTFGLDGNLYFVHDGVWSFTASGSPRWFYPYGILGSHASPAIGHNGIIYAPGGHDLTAYQSDGSIAWYVDTPFNTSDDTPVIGSDGTIYVPAADAIIAVSSSGVVDWTYQPPEINDGLRVSHISIAPDSSLRSYVSWFYGSSFVYALDSLGQTLWKTEIFTNTLTGEDAYARYPMTIDRVGNTYFCTGNSRCYGIDTNGNIIWEYEFPLVDSIIISAGSQPILVDDGLFFLTDNKNRLYAFADPDLYPILRTSKENYSFDLEIGTQPFTLTIPITSTVSPISYTVSMTHTNWLTISSDTTDVTPSNIRVQIDSTALDPGKYQTSFLIQPVNRIGKWLEISFELQISSPPNPNLNKSVFIPFIKKGGTPHPNKILHFSGWFTEIQFAVIDSTGQNREVITNHLPNQIYRVVYSPDGTKVALVVYINNRYQIMIMDIMSGEMLFDITEPGNNDFPTWSPDSQSIVFWSTRDDEMRGEIYKIHLNSLDIERLTFNDLQERDNILWSPAGDQIAFQVDWNKTYLMDSDGSNVTRLLPDINKVLVIPDEWSPNGRYLILRSRKSIDSHHELLVYDFHTESYTLLVDQIAYQNKTSWSPDGKQIAYIAPIDTNESDVFVISPDGNNKINVTNSPSNYSQLTWSPDSQWLTFVDKPYNEDVDIFVVRKDGTSFRLVTSNTQDDTFPGWQQYP